MIGLGIDLCEIARMENIFFKTPSFAERYFTQEERSYIKARAKAGASSAAAIYAAKEAFLKAAGLGIGNGILLSDISITHQSTGAPAYLLKGGAQDWMERAGAVKAHLSITHEAGLAGAVCVIE